MPPRCGCGGQQAKNVGNSSWWNVLGLRIGSDIFFSLIESSLGLSMKWREEVEEPQCAERNGGSRFRLLPKLNFGKSEAKPQVRNVQEGVRAS